VDLGLSPAGVVSPIVSGPPIEKVETCLLAGKGYEMVQYADDFAPRHSLLLVT
jgi:hypothetical protein